MKNENLNCMLSTVKVNTAADNNRDNQKSNSELLKKLKRSVLAIFCAGLLMGTTSCCKSIGCGTWGKIKAKPNSKQYACYRGYN